jgi:hypothetical protein
MVKTAKHIPSRIHREHKKNATKQSAWRREQKPAFDPYKQVNFFSTFLFTADFDLG